jgi:hypothetical protein
MFPSTQFKYFTNESNKYNGIKMQTQGKYTCGKRREHVKYLCSERNVHLNKLQSCTLQLKMAEKENNFQDMLRVCCKIHTLLGVAATDIKSDLDNVYGDSALSYFTVRR